MVLPKKTCAIIRLNGTQNLRNILNVKLTKMIIGDDISNTLAITHDMG